MRGGIRSARAELVADRERAASDVVAPTPSMNDAHAAEQPIVIERVERSSAEGDQVELTISGTSGGEGTLREQQALLVVERDGRRHRFPAEPSEDDERASATWSVSFTIPAWAEPRPERPATLWLGEAALRVPPAGTRARPKRGVELLIPRSTEPGIPEPTQTPDLVWAAPAPRRRPKPDPMPDPASDLRSEPLPEPPNTESSPAEQGSAPDPGRTGPLADMLFRETVAALRAELEQRSADAARLRAALMATRSELEARAGAQAGLEATHGELRDELEQLVGAVERYRQEFDRRLEDSEAAQTGLREQLVAATVARDAALAETSGLRSELERLGTELAVAREQAAARGSDLGEAERLLADARALTEQLRVEIPQ